MASLVHSIKYFIKYLNEKIMPILHKHFYKVPEKKMLLNSFYEVSITMKTSQEKKLQTNIFHEQRHKISLAKYE